MTSQSQELLDVVSAWSIEVREPKHDTDPSGIGQSGCVGLGRQIAFRVRVAIKGEVASIHRSTRLSIPSWATSSGQGG